METMLREGSSTNVTCNWQSRELPKEIKWESRDDRVKRTNEKSSQGTTAKGTIRVVGSIAPAFSTKGSIASDQADDPTPGVKRHGFDRTQEWHQRDWENGLRSTRHLPSRGFAD